MASLTNEAAASSSSSSLPLSSTDHQKHYTYEVFLSFRGEDTRFNFTDHLYTALCQRGIETFRDDRLTRGEDISQELLKAIEKSRVSIVVFSQNYASSRWCLDELVKILKCKSEGQKVKPVFYKVDPSDVRHQRGTFADALKELESTYKDRVGEWKAALTAAANLSGWHLKNDVYEAKFIEGIVRELSAELNLSCDLYVAEHPIGLEPCIQGVNSLLNVVEYMVGIWGPGGIGKSTIAKAVFNSIRHNFEGSCFLEEVRSNSNDLAKLAHLQEILLFDILGDSDLKVHSVDKGVGLIRTRMQNKKVLLILDDVSDYSQLQKLVPPPECFGPDSRILITTRDKGWLAASVGVYEVKMLNDEQTLELFSMHAFKSNKPPDDCLELARRAVHYAGGLPLALTVLGSHLSPINKDMWEATLDSCKGDPHLKIRNILKVSYDALGVDLQGCFLDIACFFKGEYVDCVKLVLEACYDLKSGYGILQLQEKALIRIDRKGNWMGGKIWMHDLIEEMGKDIVDQQSRGEPGECSRVWSEEDVNDVLTNNTGTNKVVGIQTPWGFSISLNPKSFSEMKKLRYISISRMMKYESFSGDIDYLSDQLRWFDWPECPLQCFPSNFHAKKLVNLDISGSCRITRLWEGRKNFPRLTCMNLSGCASLKELPDFSGIPNLKKLDLSWCTSLVEVPDSIRFLHNLVTLKVDNCSNLIMFPRKINLKSVETISVSSCKLEEFSEVGEEMGFLRKLDLRSTCIKELHPSITKLIGLEKLDLWDCENLTTLPDNIYELHNLKTLNASGCSKLATFPKIPVKMASLRRLSLKGSDIRELDESIENLIGLEHLDITDCKNLTTLPCSIYGLQNLWFLDLGECSKLVRFPTKTKILNVDGRSLSLPKLGVFSIAGCSSLLDCDFLMALDCWETLQWLNLSRNNFVSLPACLTKFVNLPMVDLEGCWRLRRIPELPPSVVNLCVDSLRRLYLNNSDIRELDESIEDLIGLEKLDLWNCKNLITLPYNIYELHSLKSLEAIGCSKLATFPKIPVKMDSLRRLSLKGSDIRELDESIGNLIGLEELDLTDCKNLTTLPCNIYGLHNLKLSVGGCSKLATFPKIPVKMGSLRLLSLKGSDIRELDESIGNLIGLEELYLTDCKNLTTLPCSIYGLHNLKTLAASGCSKLAAFPKIPVKMNSLRLLSLEGSDIRELDESIRNLIGLEYLDLTNCENLITLPCSIYGLQNLWFLDLGECSKLVRFPTNTKILNVDGRSLSLPKLGVFSIAGCSSLSDCDFLMALDCWETLQWLNLSRNNFVSLPACLTKFVNLRDLDLEYCERLREIPELPPNVKPQTWGCESLEERFSTLTNRGAVIEAASLSIEEPTPSSGLSLSSDAPKRHRTTEEPSPTPVNPPKRQRTAAGGQASMVHSAHEMAISPIPMIPDLQTHHGGWHNWRSYILSANDDYHHQQEQQEHVSITELVRNFNTIRNQLSC